MNDKADSKFRSVVVDKELLGVLLDMKVKTVHSDYIKLFISSSFLI